jgi:hypothetical protein
MKKQHGLTLTLGVSGVDSHFVLFWKYGESLFLKENSPVILGDRIQ